MQIFCSKSQHSGNFGNDCVTILPNIGQNSYSITIFLASNDKTPRITLKKRKKHNITPLVPKI